MAAKYTLNVSVTEHLHGFVAAQIASGRFYTASEVVRAALRGLEQQLDGQSSQGKGDEEFTATRRQMPLKDRT